MKVSLNTVKQYIDFELPPVDELVKRINEQLGKVEEVIDLAPKYKDAVIVKVVACEKHPNADRLNVTKIDDGGLVVDVPRDDNGYVQVVCGAPNVHADMFAVWLPPKSTVPASFDDAEPFVLDARELRGVLSQGMLAAGDELAINGDHDGIIEINPDEWKPNDIDIKPGTSFAKAYGLDDTIIDIENKMFTHRPDLFGQLGVAREIAGILGHQFTSPDWYRGMEDGRWKMEDGKQLSLSVFNDAREKVPRFMAVALKNIEIKPSPLWLQIELMRLGSKAINNIVDVTNYVMLLTAQPTHAYDYDKLRGHKLGARMAKDGERITLLNHKTYELTSDDIVIADGEGPVGLAGIMGGGDSEVDENTKNIVLEVANFDMYTIRKSSMRHGVFTDALTRFNKGQSPLQNDRVLSLLMMSIKDLSPTAEQASDVFDLKDENIKVVQHDKRVILGDGTEKDKSIFTWGSVSGVIVLENTFVNDRLGLKLSPTEVCDLLRNVEIKANEEPEPNTPDQFEVIAPFWRTDIELPEDIVEEVGRLYGFDKLPRELPTRSIKPAMKNKQREMKQHVRERLSRAGANEVLTYSFVHENSMKKAGQNPVHAYRLGNALSPDLQYYRLSLTPSLLDKVHMNVRAGYDAFALFEIGKTHYKGEMDIDEPTVPNEDSHVALVLAYGDKCKPAGSAYYVARKYLEQLGDMRAVSLQSLSDFDLSTDPWGAELTAPYEPKRTAVIVRDGKVWGVVGEFRQVVKTALKLPDYTAGFEIHTALLDDQRQAAYAPLSRYPSVERDVCFQVGPDIPYAAVRQAIDKALENVTLTIKVQPLDFYQPADATYKNLTFRITMTSHEQTLTNDMAHEIVDTVSERVCSDVDATVI